MLGPRRARQQSLAAAHGHPFAPTGTVGAAVIAPAAVGQEAREVAVGGRPGTERGAGDPAGRRSGAGGASGTITPMIVGMNADGAVVRDADDCGRLRVETTLDAGGLATALRTTELGAVAVDGDVWLDLAVLRSRARLATSAPDWPQRWAAMVAHAERAGWLSDDGLAVRVYVEQR